MLRAHRRSTRFARVVVRFHVRSRGCAFVDLNYPLGAPRVVEDPLGRRGLARVDVGHDPDVAGLLEGEFARHGGLSRQLLRAVCRYVQRAKKRALPGPGRARGEARWLEGYVSRVSM